MTRTRLTQAHRAHLRQSEGLRTVHLAVGVIAAALVMLLSLVHALGSPHRVFASTPNTSAPKGSASGVETSNTTATSSTTSAPARQSAPSVSLLSTDVVVGTQVSLRIAGFASTVVTIQVCGNEARRGSVDCNIAEALTIDFPREATTLLAEFTIPKPPVPCPCIVQVASQRFDEVAVAAVNLLGHPSAPVVDEGTAPIPLQVSIAAERSRASWWARTRTSLAGSTAYDVTVIVKNVSASVVSGTALDVEVGRDVDDLIRTVAFPEVGDLAPQEVWRQTVRTKLSSPVYGTVVWRATATVFNRSTTASTTSRNHPVLFVVFGFTFVLAVMALLVRVVLRMVRRFGGWKRFRKRVDPTGPPATSPATHDA